MSNGIQPPFEAYQGETDAIFISYAHRDAEVVYPEINRLHELGYHIWYDEGIDPGNEWPEEIAKALDNCTLFLAFISKRSASSINCRNEINYALNNKKLFLSIYLEDVVLPGGLALRMGDLQAVMKYRMEPESYARKIEKALKGYLNDAAPNLSDKDILTSAQKIAHIEASETSPAKKGNPWPMAITGLAVISILAAYFLTSSTSPIKNDGAKDTSLAKEPNPTKSQPLTHQPQTEQNYAVAGLSVGKSKQEILAILEQQKSSDSWSSPVLRYLLLPPEKPSVDHAKCEAELMAAGLNLVERAQMESIMKEQALSQSMLSDPATKLKLGKLMSARIFLELDEGMLKVFDAQTSETFFMKPLTAENTLAELKKVLKDRFRSKGKVISAGEPGEFYINLGSQHSLKQDMTLMVLREGAPIRHGERILGHKKDKIGQAKVTACDDTFSTLKGDHGVDVQVGDLVIEL